MNRRLLLIYRFVYSLGIVVEPIWGLYLLNQGQYYELLWDRILLSILLTFVSYLCWFKKDIFFKYSNSIIKVVIISFMSQRYFAFAANPESFNYCIDVISIAILSMITLPRMKDLVPFGILMGAPSLLPIYNLENHILASNMITMLPIVGAFKYAFFKIVLELTELQEKVKENAIFSGAKDLSNKLSHNLNNILAKISTANEVIDLDLEESKDSGEEHKILSRDNFDSISEMNSMIKLSLKESEMLISFLKNIATHDELEMSLVQSKDIFENLINWESKKMSSLNIKLENKITSYPIVFCDPIQFQKVVVALLANAMENLGADAKGERKILLTLDLDESYFYFNISNTGSKIDASIVEDMFEPFFTTKKIHGEFGLGLGLSLAKKIMTQHRGDLEYITQEDIDEKHLSNCFRIKIPRNSN